MATSSKKQAAAIPSAFEKLLCVGGDGCFTRSRVQDVFSDYQGRLYADKGTAPRALLEFLTRRQMLRPALPLLVEAPTAPLLAVLDECFAAGTVAVPLVIVHTPDSWLDGRTRFAKTAEKAGRVEYLGPIPYDPQGRPLLLELDRLEKEEGVCFDQEARRAVVRTAPVRLTRARGAQREIEAYDFDCFDREIGKLLPLAHLEKRPLTGSDIVHHCHFQHDEQIWGLIDAIVQGNGQECLHFLEEFLIGAAQHNLLSLALGQLVLLSRLSEMWAVGLRSADQIAAELSDGERYRGKFLRQGWLDPAEAEGVAAAAINPWRVRKALETRRLWDTPLLLSRTKAVLNAIRDLRGGGTDTLVRQWLSAAVEGGADYSEPLYAY